MVLPRAAELLERDRCGMTISDLLWDARQHPACLLSIGNRDSLSGIYTAALLHCFSLAKAENAPSPPFCKELILHIGFSKDFDMVILSNLEAVFYLFIPGFPIFPVLEKTAHFWLWTHSPFLEYVC